jgi:predicted P-loop ATPase
MISVCVLSSTDRGSVEGVDEFGTLTDLADKLRATTAIRKDQLALVVGATFAAGHRSKETCQGRDVVALDIDGGMTMAEALAKLRASGLSGLVHTTASSTPNAPRLRIFVVLSRPVLADEWDAKVKPWMKKTWGTVDTNALDISRSSYMPIVGVEVETIDGVPLDVDTLADARSSPTATPAITPGTKPLPTDAIEQIRAMWPAEHGNRHELRKAVAGYLLSDGYSADSIADAFPKPDGTDERAQVVRDTARKLADGDAVTTFGSIVGIVGQENADKLKALTENRPIVEALAQAKATLEAERAPKRYSATHRPMGKLAPISLSALAHDLSTRTEWADVIALDVFTGQKIMRPHAPIEANARIDRDGEWSDADTRRVKQWFEVHADVQPSIETVESAVMLVAEENKINLAVEALDACGPSHAGAIEELADVLGLKSTIERKMLRKWLISACARAHVPGVFVKSALVLYGKQDAGKSSMLRALFGKYHTTINGDLADRKIVGEKVAGFWCVEIEEAAALTRTDLAAMKSCISDTHDNYRASYGRHATKHPRSCVFAVTVNENNILRDPTGEVRYWCVTVADEIDLDRVTGLRDAVWAEARDAYRGGELYYFTDDADKAAAAERAETMRDVDPIEEHVARFLEGKAEVTTNEVVADLSRGFDPAKTAAVNASKGRVDHRVNSVLKVLGWEQRNTHGKGRYWVLQHSQQSTTLASVAPKPLDFLGRNGVATLATVNSDKEIGWVGTRK